MHWSLSVCVRGYLLLESDMLVEAAILSAEYKEVTVNNSENAINFGKY